MQIRTTPSFNKILKKLHLNQIKLLDSAIREINRAPNAGTLKIGDLNSLRFYKYQSLAETWLLAYTIEDEWTILLHSVGPHENFYEKLKRKF